MLYVIRTYTGGTQNPCGLSPWAYATSCGIFWQNPKGVLNLMEVEAKLIEPALS
jgi:hypothetical protein